MGAAFSVGAIAAFAKNTMAAADELRDLSDITGVGVENLQTLQVLFQKNGKSAGDVAGVLSILRKNLEEAAGGNEKMAQSILKLGINLDDVAAGRTDKVFEQIAKAMQNAAGDMQMGEAAGNLLGRGYATL
ncbi:MAG: hypothetical protein FJ388_09645, partial [Verrucomicrobia bacterium]|nr:hypothetical protein [Verrucomicrobiota bacterium]